MTPPPPTGPPIRPVTPEERAWIRRADAAKLYRDMVSWRALAQRNLETGELIGRICLCQRLLKREETPRETLVRCPREELQSLADQLEKQLLPSRS
jgi:hypothetical protein